MRGPVIPREASWLRYQERRRRETEAVWSQDPDGSRVRDALSDWVSNEARRRAANPVEERRTGRLGPQLERLMLLAGLHEAARRFATLSRSSDDDDAAVWMLGLATADAVAKCPEPATWHFAQAILTPSAYESFEAELVLRMRADPILFERFCALAATIVDGEVADPVSCVPAHTRDSFAAAITEWVEPEDFISLSGPLPGTDLYWGPSSEILSLVHAVDRETFITLLTRFRLPHPVQAALASRAITDDVSEIAALLRLAPPTFDGDGIRIVSTIAPLLLWTGLEHLRRRIRWPDDEDAVEDVPEEVLAADLAWAATEFAGAALGRCDGRSLGFAWATALVRDLAWRLTQAGSVPPPAADAGASPAWFALHALVEHPSARSWTGWRSPTLAPEDAYFAAVAAVLPALAASDPNGLGDERLPIPAGLDDAADIEATRITLALATRPSDWIYQILGWTIAQGPNPARRWSEIWRSIAVFREQDLRRLGRKLDGGTEAVAKAVWAIGLGALDWLSASEAPGAADEHDALYSRLYDAALESWLTAAVPEEYWSNAVVHVAVRWSRLVRQRIKPDGPPSETSAEEVSVLANVIRPFVAPGEHFLRMVRSLQRNGTALSTIRDALVANGSSLDDIIATVGALGAIDARFASRTTGFLAHLGAPIEDHGPQLL